MKLIKQKVIIVILPKGKANNLVKLLVNEYEITAIDIHYARGVGRITPLSHRGVGETSEKEILTLSTKAEQADEVFEYIYFQAGINQPHGGLMYMHDLTMSSKYELPDIVEES